MLLTNASTYSTYIESTKAKTSLKSLPIHPNIAYTPTYPSIYGKKKPRTKTNGTAPNLLHPNHIPPPPLKPHRTTSAHRPKIPPVRRRVRLILIIARVPVQIHVPLQHAHVRARRLHARQRGNVVLRTHVHESEIPRREPGYRVVVVRDAVVAALGLGGDVVA